MKAPDSQHTLQSFMGMVNYLKKFTPVLTELSEPLRSNHGVKWVWEYAHQTAVTAIIKVITNLPVPEYFDSTMDHVILTDASRKGLGTVFLQTSKPVMYVSRALTETEQNYSSIESYWVLFWEWKDYITIPMAELSPMRLTMSP